MGVELITEAANGSIDKEIDLLEWEVLEGATEMEIYTRLSELYRKKKQYVEAVFALEVGFKVVSCPGTGTQG